MHNNAMRNGAVGYRCIYNNINISAESGVIQEIHNRW